MAVTIVEVKRRSRQGVTRPFYCRGDDDRWYWAKGNFAGKAALCYEWLAGRVAQEFKMRFDSAISAPTVDYGLAGGTIARSAQQLTDMDKARFEVPAVGFAAYQDDKRSLLLLSEEKYGFDCRDGSLGLSLLTSPYDNDKSEVPDPLTDRGRHHIECTLIPGCEPLTRSEMHRRSLLHRHQPKVLWGETPDEGLTGDGLRVEGAIPFYVKPSGDGVLLYCFEPEGKAGTVTISAGEDVRCSRCDLLAETREAGPAGSGPAGSALK